MSIFSTILDKLGLHKETPTTPAATPASGPAATTHTAAAPTAAAPVHMPAPPARTSAAPSAAAPGHTPAAPTTSVSMEHVPTASTHTMAAATPATPAPAASAPLPTVSMEHVPAAAAAPAPTPAATVAEARPEAVTVVDVYAKLEGLAAKRPEKLNWKTSIADLLFLLGIDHSYQARKELAVELGCPQNLMDDSAKMNTWLHKTVLTRIAENGGNIPKELLD